MNTTVLTYGLGAVIPALAVAYGMAGVWKRQHPAPWLLAIIVLDALLYVFVGPVLLIWFNLAGGALLGPQAWLVSILIPAWLATALIAFALLFIPAAPKRQQPGNGDVGENGTVPFPRP